MSETATAEVKPTAQTEPVAKEGATAEVKPTAQTEPVAKEGATAEVKPTATAKTKDVTIPCKYAQVRVGTEYFTPDHEGNITVPAELAKEAKKVCGE